ncbi:MAG: MalY/PatB family protein [Lysinibacillus sp.]
MSIFDELHVRRSTRSVKWDKMDMVYNFPDTSDVLPMWVADMDFAAPKEVIDALRKRLEHPVFGYSYVCDDCKNAVVSWFERRHQWTIDPKTILFNQGVVPAIASIIETFTEPGDKIAISTPVYPPFFNVPQHQQREVVSCDLIEEDGFYHYDFDRLEETFKQGVSMYILCNPHNPGGIVWSQEDLERLVELAIQYDVMIISDEIHADLLIDGSRHIPLLTVKRADEARIITCIAPTKTFNIAGIQAAMMVVPNSLFRSKLTQHALAHGHFELNAFASAAAQAAYAHGDAWLDELLAYLSRNMDYVIQELTAIPGVQVAKPQATYLMWIDYRATGIEEKEMMDRLLTTGKLALEPGTKYGEAGRGFLRMNVAAPFETVKDGVQRFKKVFE